MSTAYHDHNYNLTVQRLKTLATPFMKNSELDLKCDFRTDHALQNEGNYVEYGE